MIKLWVLIVAIATASTSLPERALAASVQDIRDFLNSVEASDKSAPKLDSAPTPAPLPKASATPDTKDRALRALDKAIQEDVQRERNER